MFTVKLWASRRCIKEPKNGGLSSYSFVLLVIHYLQVATPPVLPCLQDEKYFRSDQDQRGAPAARTYYRPRSDPKMVYDVSFCADPKKVGGWVVYTYTHTHRHTLTHIRTLVRAHTRVYPRTPARADARMHNRTNAREQASERWRYERKGHDNKRSVSELLCEFFAYYAVILKFQSHIISIRTGGTHCIALRCMLLLANRSSVGWGRGGHIG